NSAGVANGVTRLFEGLQWAVANGARVVSISQEMPEFNDALGNLIAAHPDCLVVVAAGNDNQDLDTVDRYPASYKLPNMISVIATSWYGSKVGSSNYATTEAAHIGAPGDGVPCCDGDSDVAFQGFSETSIAAPHVAGVCALVWQANPNATAAEVKNWVLTSGALSSAELPPGSDLPSKCMTGGLVNARRAVRLALGLPADPV